MNMHRTQTYIDPRLAQAFDNARVDFAARMDAMAAHMGKVERMVREQPGRSIVDAVTGEEVGYIPPVHLQNLAKLIDENAQNLVAQLKEAENPEAQRKAVVRMLRGLFHHIHYEGLHARTMPLFHQYLKDAETAYIHLLEHQPQPPLMHAEKVTRQPVFFRLVDDYLGILKDAQKVIERLYDHAADAHRPCTFYEQAYQQYQQENPGLSAQLDTNGQLAVQQRAVRCCIDMLAPYQEVLGATLAPEVLGVVYRALIQTRRQSPDEFIPGKDPADDLQSQWFDPERVGVASRMLASASGRQALNHALGDDDSRHPPAGGMRRA